MHLSKGIISFFFIVNKGKLAKSTQPPPKTNTSAAPTKPANPVTARGTTELLYNKTLEPEYPVLPHVFEDQSKPLSNSDQDLKRFIITYKKGYAPILPLSASILGESTKNNFIVVETSPEMAFFLNDTDKAYVEEDVLYSFMDPIPPIIAMEDATNHSISEQHSRLLDMLIEPEIVPYGIEMVNASRVSAARIKNRKVCIIDTGYTYDHEDLPKSQVTGYSGPLNSFANWKEDGHGHGTHVAGIIAALKNDIGVVGIHPAENMSLHIIRIFNDEAKQAWASDVIASVQECVDVGSNVINMSLGRHGGGKGALQTEIDAYKKFLNEDNVIVVAAAGNTGDNTFWYPAAYDDVIGVAGVTADKERGYYSCHNSKVDIAAPGSNIFSTWKYGGYQYSTGTSMAAPHVAGVAALVWSHFKEISAVEMKKSLFSSAEDLGSQGRDDFFGHGLVNAKAAYDTLAQGGSDGRGSYRNDRDFRFKFGKKNRGCWFLKWTTDRWLRKNNDIYQAMKSLNNKCFRRGIDGDFVYERCKKSCFTI